MLLQNEDNNTRVLFERSLTSGCLRPEQQTEIWNKFIEFEANLGDMASIIKGRQTIDDIRAEGRGMGIEN